jgi:hypothetical protein
MYSSSATGCDAIICQQGGWAAAVRQGTYYIHVTGLILNPKFNFLSFWSWLKFSKCSPNTQCIYILLKHKKHELSVARNGCFSWKSNKLQQELFSNFRAWMETLEVLRGQTLETPVLVWNDVKRKELKKVYNNIGLLRVSLGFRV